MNNVVKTAVGKKLKKMNISDPTPLSFRQKTVEGEGGGSVSVLFSDTYHHSLMFFQKTFEINSLPELLYGLKIFLVDDQFNA